MGNDVRSDTGSDSDVGIAEAVKARVKAEEAIYPDTSLNNGKIDPQFIEMCMGAAELGDGVFYAELQRDKFIYNVIANEWLVWTDHYWEYDDHNKARAAVEDQVSILLDRVKVFTDWIDTARQKKDADRVRDLEKKRTVYYARIAKLRTKHRRNNCLEFAISCRKPLTIRTNDLDLDPWLLGCVNGVMDLKAGKFKDGRPRDYITRVSPIEWKGFDIPCPQWVKFIQEIMNEDLELVDYLHKLLGYAISGLQTEMILPVFWGRGRNGKGTLVRVLLHIMGNMAQTIKPEILLYNRLQRSSEGSDPAVLDLQGLRMAFASETDEGQSFSAAKVKLLTGGDRLVGRNLYEKRLVRFDPTHTIFLMTNDKPRVAGDDYAFWKRLVLIPFKLSYVLNKDKEELEDFERIANPFLEEELKMEASGILAWLVNGFLKYRKEGLETPQSVKDATLSYQQDEDNLGQFIEAFCIINNQSKTKSSELHEKFDKWYKIAVNKRGISQKAFGSMMKKRFDSFKSSGVVYYKNIEFDVSKQGEFEGMIEAYK